MRIPRIWPAPAVFFAAAAAAIAQAPAPVPAASPLSYADLADLTQAAPIVASVQIRNAQRLKPEQSPGLAPGVARFFIEADVLTLVRGRGGLASRIHYLADVPLDSRGKAPKLRKARKLLFGRPVAGKADEIQLVSPRAQIDWIESDEARARSIVTALVAPDAPPQVTGVASAFHVPGSLPGESETQIFLATADRRPVSLNILRRPGEEPRWAVALGEMVDEAAGPPAPDSLLWYRLACALPATLPEAATAELGDAERAAAAADYRFVIGALGACRRTLG